MSMPRRTRRGAGGSRRPPRPCGSMGGRRPPCRSGEAGDGSCTLAAVTSTAAAGQAGRSRCSSCGPRSSSPRPCPARRRGRSWRSSRSERRDARERLGSLPSFCLSRLRNRPVSEHALLLPLGEVAVHGVAGREVVGQVAPLHAGPVHVQDRVQGRCWPPGQARAQPPRAQHRPGAPDVQQCDTGVADSSDAGCQPAGRSAWPAAGVCLSVQELGNGVLPSSRTSARRSMTDAPLRPCPMW